MRSADQQGNAKSACGIYHLSKRTLYSTCNIRLTVSAGIECIRVMVFDRNAFMKDREEEGRKRFTDIIIIIIIIIIISRSSNSSSSSSSSVIVVVLYMCDYKRKYKRVRCLNRVVKYCNTTLAFLPICLPSDYPPLKRYDLAFIRNSIWLSDNALPDHTAHAQMITRVFALHSYILQYSIILLADREGPDQPARMRRLIWAFAVRLCTFSDGVSKCV